MTEIRYKGAMDFSRMRMVIKRREFAKATEQRLFYLPADVGGGPKSTSVHDWPYLSFDDAREREIEWREAKIKALEMEIADHRKAIAELDECTEPVSY